MKKLLVPVILAMLVTAGCVQQAPDNGSMPPAPENGGEVMEKNDDDHMKAPESAMMKDTSGDEAMEVDKVFQNRIVMKNVSTFEDAKGEGFYGVHDGETRVIATISIPDPEGNYFYEGWLVCGGKPYSTGALEKFEGMYENYFASLELPEVCEQYVLTLEEDDGNPAPAEHMLDGVMEGIGHAEEQMDWDDERFFKLNTPKEYVCSDSHAFTFVMAETSDEKGFYVNPSDGKSITMMRQKAASGEKFSNEAGDLSVWFKADVATVLGGEDKVIHSECK